MRSKAWIPILAGVALVAAVGVYALQNDNAAAPTENTEVTAQTQPKFLGIPVGSPRVVVPAGTPMSVVLQTTLTTKSSIAGDKFTARLASPVHVNGDVVIPAGASVSGHVAVAEQPGKASGRGKMQLVYDRIDYDGDSYELDSRSRMYESASGTKKDVALIGGGAVVGGVIGGVTGGSVAKGAAIGAATGTGASLLTRGPQLTLAAGTTLSFTLDQSIRVKPAESA